MSTNKHIDVICIVAVVVMLLLTVLFMNGDKLGFTALSGEAEGQFSQNDLIVDWPAKETAQITMTGDGASITGNGAYAAEGNVYIVYAGDYTLSGDLFDGQIIIDADGDDLIRLNLNGVTVHCEDHAALWIKQADKVVMTLPEGTENTFSSGESYSEEARNQNVDGVIFSKDDLTINGTGKLNVTGKYAHGIVCNDDLKITGGEINVTAPKDTIHANDSVRIREASLTLSAGDDGITVSNDDGSDYLYVESGKILIDQCYEGLEGDRVTIVGGEISILPDDDGMNAEKAIEIQGGTIRIVNADGKDADGLDSNGDITISGGDLFISVSQQGGSCAIDYGSERGGKCTIDGGKVVACGSSVMLEAISDASKQGFVMKSISGEANTSLTLTASDGTVLINETIPAAFSSVILSADGMHQGDVCTITVAGTQETVTVGETSDDGFGMMHKDKDGNTPTEMPEGMAMPQNMTERPDRSPNMKDNRNQPPDMADSMASPPDQPENSMNGTMPPDRPAGNDGQTQDSTSQDGSMERPQSMAQKDQPGQRNEAEGEALEKIGEEIDNDAGESTVDTGLWILIALSGLSLIIGLIVVIIKKA